MAVPDLVILTIQGHEFAFATVPPTILVATVFGVWNGVPQTSSEKVKQMMQ